MAIGKSLRFEVFARDSFVCQYCGQRPPDVILEADHIHPVSRGGLDELINLITSCYDCNRGKRAKVLSEIAPRPDADLMFLRAQQEIAEAERFLETKRRLDAIHAKIVEALQKTWFDYLTADTAPNNKVFAPWIKTYGADEVEQSIKLASTSYTAGRFGFNRYNTFDSVVRFVGGILRNRRDQKEIEVA